MIYRFFLLTFFAVSCKSQTISLEIEAQCPNNPSCQNYNYAKDINNSLNKYIGEWKGNYNGKVYEFKFNSGLYQAIGIKRDKLIGRLQIKDSNGNILYTTFNEANDSKTNFNGLGFQPNLKAYTAHFTGSSPEGCINYGTVYLSMKTNIPNQMSVLYLPDHDIVKGECPTNFISTIPEKKTITLIKQ